jgi:hypothetical protein
MIFANSIQRFGLVENLQLSLTFIETKLKVQKHQYQQHLVIKGQGQ